MQKTKRFYLLLAGQLLGLSVVFGLIFIDGNTLEGWFSKEVDFAHQSQECDLRSSPCSILLVNGATMELTISPQHIPLMTPLSFSLHTTGIEEQELSFKIYATNMDMGIHRFILKKQKEGLYIASGILPTCLVGNMRWHAEVALEKLFQDKNIGGRFHFKTD